MSGDGTCDACSGRSDRTPVEITNRPGLSAVEYRTGTWSTFRESMLAGLTRSSRPALAPLGTRSEDDPAIALIDAWATAADVLTFYTERIAQEHYLRTATERRSVADLVALLGYRLGPGVAARTWLAITAETAPGSPPAAPIPTGTRVQTLPGPGERPQTFETVEDVVAVGAWNRPAPRTTGTRTPRSGDTELLLAGTATGLRPGDELLFVAGDRDPGTAPDRWARARVTAVTPDPVVQRTAVAFDPALTGLDLVPDVEVTVRVMRGRASLFGQHAPDPRLFVQDVRDAIGSGAFTGTGSELDWDFAALAGGVIALDGLYETARVGGWAVLSGGVTAAGDAAPETLGAITSVREAGRSAYGLSGRVTELTVDATDSQLAPFGDTGVRRASVAFGAGTVDLAEVDLGEPLLGDRIPLAESLPSLPDDRAVLVRGRRARVSVSGRPEVGGMVLSAVPIPGAEDWLTWTLRTDDGDDITVPSPLALLSLDPARATDPIVGEVVAVAGSPGPGPVSELVLGERLVNVYDRMGDTPVELFGNVAEATQGETVAGEVLGSADATRPFQRFALKRRPLTFVPSPGADGAESTLEVRVNGVRWREVPTLFGTGPAERVHVTETADDGTTTVVFGDGATGAPTPTGADNVVATYRHGAGLDGNARLDQISLPTTRPLGLKAVTNPLAAEGAQDPQRAADARTNAPRSVLTLGRVVALQDYADFAADFGGVAKATVTWTWDGVRRGVLVTVAAPGGVPVESTSPLLTDLRTSLLAAGTLRVPLVVTGHRPATFALTARLRTAPGHDPQVVRDAVAAALRTGYGFEARDFGQGVAQSEIVRAVHGVPGVDGVRLDRLHRTDDAVARNGFLVAATPAAGSAPGVPAPEILTLEPDGPDLEVGW